MSCSWLLVVMAATLVAAACAGGGSPARLSIAVIPKGTSHVFWQSIHAGAESSLGGRPMSTSRGAARFVEDNRDAQVAEIENAVGRGALAWS